MHEVSENLSKELSNNTFIEFIHEHKKQLDKIQQEEQQKQFGSIENKGPVPTYSNCIECHKKQTLFWQSTAHSSSYITLLKKIKKLIIEIVLVCHSYILKKLMAFFTKEKIIIAEKKVETKKYWQEVLNIYKGTEEIRKLKPRERKKTRRNGVP